jgi:hypothetical protein
MLGGVRSWFVFILGNKFFFVVVVILGLELRAYALSRATNPFL